MTAPTVARSHIETEAYEPFEVNGTPCGELHALRTTSSGTGALFAGLWRHPAGQLDYVFPADETFHMRKRHPAAYAARARGGPPLVTGGF
ncbi:MAG TPA: hypothetical protein DDY91_03340 [Planctomycetaceae bacterium]|nr:hypothetical protein [Planctomycetaceae bacterium]